MATPHRNRLGRAALACMLLLPWMQALAASSGGLLLEAPRRVRAPAIAVTSGCSSGGMLLLSSNDSTARAPAQNAGGGFRFVVVPTRGADRPTSIPGELARLIDAAASAYGHDVSLVKAIVRVESAFNPMAVSNKGAMGLMQIMPATAMGLGVADPTRDLLDPETNLRAGARHLRMLRNKFPDRLDLVIAAYNAGEGAVARWAGIPPYAETQAYVESVLAWRSRYQQSADEPVQSAEASSNWSSEPLSAAAPRACR